MEKVKRVPKLRFFEFSEEWKLKKLREVCEMTSSKRVYVSDYVEEGIPFYRGKEITELKSNKTPTDILFITEERYNDYKAKYGVPTKGDILITAVGTLGNVWMVKDYSKFYFKDGNLIWLKNIIVDNDYLEILLQSNTREFLKTSIGSTQRALTMVELRKIQLFFPSLKEQQKIASFLSAVDKKIQQLQQKQGLLEDYKKGVMQQIFSQQLRFTKEGGSAYPDWEEKKFNEIYSFYSTNSFSRDKLNYESGEVRNVHYGDIHTKFSTLFDINEELVPYVNNEIDLSKVKKESYLQLGDLLIADASEDYNDIGKTIEVVNLNDEKVISGLHTFHARPNKHKMALGFSGYLLQSWLIRKQVMKIAQGTKVLGISTGRLAEIKFFIPSYAEQTQIAHFLSAIDKKIAVVQTQITQTQQFKKGLLQQMFV